jgi:hypothetical protein
MTGNAFDPVALHGEIAAAMLFVLTLTVRLAAHWLIAPRLTARGWWPQPYDPPVWWWHIRLALGARRRPDTMRTRATTPTTEHR